LLSHVHLVGSAASEPNAFPIAVRDARRAFDQRRDIGFDMTILNVGGGFQDYNFDLMAPGLRRAIEEEFPSRNVRIIAEPGRFYARSYLYYTIVCKAISCWNHNGGASFAHVDMLYQNDGIYGCFMNRVTKEELFVPALVTVDNDLDVPRSQGKNSSCYSVWGPTCDSVDCISDRAILHCEALVGDWLKYEDMGGKSQLRVMLICAWPDIGT
jgi:ornithine decarboxylase